MEVGGCTFCCNGLSTTEVGFSQSEHLFYGPAISALSVAYESASNGWQLGVGVPSDDGGKVGR